MLRQIHLNLLLNLKTSMSTITVRVYLPETKETETHIFSDFGHYHWGDEENFNARIEERLNSKLPSVNYAILGYSFSAS